MHRLNYTWIRPALRFWKKKIWCSLVNTITFVSSPVLTLRFLNMLKHFFVWKRGLLGLILLGTLPALALSSFPAFMASPLAGGAVVQVPPKGKPSFLAIGLDPKQQGTLEKAVLLAKEWQKDYPTLWVGEVPVVEASYRKHKGAIEAFMRQTVSNKELHAHVYPHYTAMATYRKTLGLVPGQNTLFVLLDAKGNVVWKKTSLPTASDTPTVL
jgi:hypothetical protein